jgi:predicted aconitase with swiveling domain
MTDRALVKGRVRGPVLFLDEPLSFWGGLDPASGRVIDRHHPQLGLCLTGAIVVGEPDEIIVTGCLVAAELYGTTVPVLVATEGTIRTLESAAEVSIDVDGSISVE